jgi:hypothetical protein
MVDAETIRSMGPDKPATMEKHAGHWRGHPAAPGMHTNFVNITVE